jgi:uncharacterized protein
MSRNPESTEREIVRRIVEASQPDKAILFGSRARGDARRDSDYDILVIKDSEEPRYRRSVPLYVALTDLLANMDLLVYTPAEVEDWETVPQAFITTAMREVRWCMKDVAELARGWLRKASSDIVSVDATIQAGALDSACFHAQQACASISRRF